MELTCNGKGPSPSKRRRSKHRFISNKFAHHALYPTWEKARMPGLKALAYINQGQFHKSGNVLKLRGRSNEMTRAQAFFIRYKSTNPATDRTQGGSTLRGLRPNHHQSLNVPAWLHPGQLPRSGNIMDSTRSPNAREKPERGSKGWACLHESKCDKFWNVRA